ncbi:MAG: hypothetical protein JRI72_14490 [Deltaproteobacteria bacterium]|nr:hypothetical protein [Deltaproteobacteria bacterium]
MEKIASNDREFAYNFLKKYLFSRFDLDSDNSLVVSALSEVASCDITSLNNLQKEYNLEKEGTKKAFTEKSLMTLKESGVSGSAVVPNLDNIPEWNEFLKTLRERYQEQLQTIENK